MATIRFVCPSGHPLSAEENLTGTSLRCATCGETAIVPPAEQAVDPHWPARRRDRRRRKPESADEQHLAAATGMANARPVAPRESKRMRRIERPRPAVSLDIYQPDARRIAAVKGLAAALGAIIAFSLLPVFKTGSLNLATAPGWATAALLLAVVQGFYVAWLLAAPDWSSVWVLMVVFAVSAAGYAAATPVAAFAPPERLAALGMPSDTRFAAGWCACVMLTLLLGTYLCGRMATRWRRAHQLDMAAKRRAARAAR